MIDIDKSRIMTEECIQNYQNFLKKNRADTVKKSYYAIENYEYKNNEELFPSIKVIDRRQEDDPSYQGYFALEKLDQRKNPPMVFQKSNRIEWVKYSARNLLGEELFY